MLTYEQTTGKLTDGRGMPWATGYSGHDEGKNNPALQSDAGVGPIPQGRYRIGAPFTSTRTGPFAMALTPVSGEQFGRGDFEIHGDSREHPGEASHGCIIMPLIVRQRIDRENADRLLEVIA